MSWTEEKQTSPENQSLNNLISENSELRLMLEEAKSIMNEQNSLITELKNKQASLAEIEKMQENLQEKEQKLKKKEQIYSEIKENLVVNQELEIRFKTDFNAITSPAFDIIKNSSKTLAGGVKGLKYKDLEKILEIILEVREEAEITQRHLKSSIKNNQKLINGGLDKFALRIHDAKLEEQLNIKIRRELGLIQ